MATPRKTQDRAKKTAPKKAPKKTTETGRTTQAEPQAIATAASFKAGTDVLLPSNNLVLARRVGLDTFMRNGFIPNSIMPLITKALDEGKAPSKRQLADAVDISSDGAINDMMKMYDDVLVYCVLQPKVTPMPTDETGEVWLDRKDPDLLYPDDVDFEDKQFLFNWAVGGTADVARFRNEQEKAVEPVSSGEGMEQETE